MNGLALCHKGIYNLLPGSVFCEMCLSRDERRGYAAEKKISIAGCLHEGRVLMTYEVLVTKHNEKFMARVRAWPEVIVEGDTEEEVLRKAQADLKALLMTGRIVQFELDVKPDEHPWQAFAGMFADDPDSEAFQAAMQQYRKDIDSSGAEE